MVLSGKARTVISNGRLVNHIGTDVSRVDFCAGLFVTGTRLTVPQMLTFSTLPQLPHVLVVACSAHRHPRTPFASSQANPLTDGLLSRTQQIILIIQIGPSCLVGIACMYSSSSPSVPH
jgi:hypothetical protein